MRRQEDWYAYLNIATDAPTGQVEQAVERLSRQATALAVTAPERSQRLRDTVRAQEAGNPRADPLAASNAGQ
jgi:hypothetical protein